MKLFANGITKFFVSNLAVVCIIILLPVFLVTSEIPLYHHLIDYLFGSDEIV